jgi:hypothetical protein
MPLKTAIILVKIFILPPEASENFSVAGHK